jgi:hypothetical protein
MLDDPRINFAISTWNVTKGVNHLGLQADSEDELGEIGARFAAADRASTVAERDAHCCYAVSNKHWVQDPQGIAWEAFHTLDSIPTFSPEAETSAEAGCCDSAHVVLRRAGGREGDRRGGGRSLLRMTATAGAERGSEQSAAFAERAVPVHRQLRALDHRRIDSSARGRWPLQGLQRGQSTGRQGQSACAGALAPEPHADGRHAQQELGRIRGGRSRADGLRDHRVRQRRR